MVNKPLPPSVTSDVFKWFISRIQKVVDMTTVKSSDKYDRVNRISPHNIGQMFLFYYEAKLKKKLPYWDRFPLIFPIKFYPNGFLGINLHYVSPDMRKKMLTALYGVITNVGSPDQRLKVNNEFLQNTARIRSIKPCIKRYLYTHVGTEFYQVKPEEWGTVIQLPQERFTTMTRKSITKQQVWNESIKKMGL